ncbi:MAG: Bax inhibitor-1/YccA family protein [Holosporaceae bacterium]|jgi:FtsH-binding integral membrane protein|nr:Bax inhibitor-1/YccA family protein [Holosporaceae bacterium]
MKNKVTPFYKEAVDVVNAGLRKYMLSVFSHMSIGLALTAIVAYLVSTSPALMSFLFSNAVVFWIVALAPLGIAVYLSTKISSLSAEKAKGLFYAYSGCLGLSLSSLFIVYTGSSIACTFFTTSSMFLSMVIYGYVTQKDLSSWGSLLIMGLLGIIIASIINIFTRSSGADLVISLLGVVIFTGLTAYDTQTIKNYYLDSDSTEVGEKKAVFGAFQLYLDFINLFLYILRFFGKKR